jgi:hypothetical protein
MISAADELQSGRRQGQSPFTEAAVSIGQRESKSPGGPDCSYIPGGHYLGMFSFSSPQCTGMV